jgi:hypothetical protein
MAKRDLGGRGRDGLSPGPGIGSALLAALGVYLVLAAQSLLGTIAFVITDPGLQPGRRRVSRGST